MSYARVVAEFRNRAWALKADTFGEMVQLVGLWARGEKFSEQEVEVRIRDANARNGVSRESTDIYHEPQLFPVYGGPMLSSRAQGGGGSRGGSGGSIIALIPVIGLISHRANMLESISGGGGTSIEKLTSQFRAAVSNPSIKAIVLDVDSPGGSVDGVFELSQEIYEARGRTKIVAVANCLAASAGYAIAAAASELVVAPSGQVGSIGVLAAHEDHSKELERQGVKVTLVSAGKYKVEGNSLEPLSDSARAELQDRIDDFYQMFVKVVAASRGDSQANVRSGYGQGRCVTALDAVRANLADRVATLDEVLQQLGVYRQGRMPAAPRDDARLVEHHEAPYLTALRRRRRLLELDLVQREASTPADRVEDPENYIEALQRRRRELGVMPEPRLTGEQAAAATRRRQRELDTWKK